MDDYEQGIATVQSVTQAAIDAWASKHSRVLHSLSGGFDSAVVLACLARSKYRPQVTCLNRYTDEPGEDERVYARLAASRSRVELIERAWTSGGSWLTSSILESPRTPKPSIPHVVGLADKLYCNSIARELGVDSVWSGEGGDHIFYQHTTTHGASDYLRNRGFRAPFIGVLDDAARFARRPYWSVLKEAVVDARSRKPWRPELLAARQIFANRESLPENLVEYVSHPWTTDNEDIPRGKQVQIYFLAEVLNRHRPFGQLESVEEVYPLMSQPLIETCLRIPTYLLLRGGRQRALVREAFNGLLPSEITTRESKGSTTSCIIRMMRENHGFVRELLLDGILVRERLANRRQLEPYLDTARPLRPQLVFPLISCIAGEVWARRWQAAATA
jgi:asparagine synthase (glutamine-hydrolysing)